MRNRHFFGCVHRTSEHPAHHVRLFVFCSFLTFLASSRLLPHLYPSPLARLPDPPPSAGFASLRMWRQAMAAFEKAKKDGLPITSSTYTQVINVMSKGGRYVGVLVMGVRACRLRLRWPLEASLAVGGGGGVRRRDQPTEYFFALA